MEGVKMSVATCRDPIEISRTNKLTGIFQVSCAAAELIASLKSIHGIRVSWSYADSNEELHHKVIGEGSEEDDDGDTMEEVFSMMKLLQTDIRSLNGRALQVTVSPV